MNTALDPAAEPYEDSRRLTGCNFYFSGTGAVLEAAPGLSFDDATLARWRDNIDLAREALGWPDGEAVMRRHRSGVSLAFAAPLDCLYAEIGRAHVCTPVTNAHLVCRLLLEQKKKTQ